LWPRCPFSPSSPMFGSTPTARFMRGSMKVRNPRIREQDMLLRVLFQLQSERLPMNSIIYIVGLVVVVVAVLSFFGLR
jgi:hypothetical protein